MFILHKCIFITQYIFYHECYSIGSRRLIEPPKEKCLLQRELHSAGDTFHHDDCTTCSCLNGTVICHRNACPALDCPEDRQILAKGRCCRHCSPVLESISTCTIGGRTYQVSYKFYLYVSSIALYKYN